MLSALLRSLDQLFSAAVFIGMRFGVFAHVLDFALGEAGGGGDGDVLAAAGGFILEQSL